MSLQQQMPLQDGFLPTRQHTPLVARQPLFTRPAVPVSQALHGVWSAGSWGAGSQASSRPPQADMPQQSRHCALSRRLFN